MAKNKIDKIVYLIFGSVLIISLIALTGWLLNRLSLAQINENYIPMAPLTAILFLITIAIVLNFSIRKKHIYFTKAAATILLLIISFVLVDSLLGYKIDLEKILSKSNSTFNNFPIGRISPLTTFLFIIVLLSILFHTTNYKRSKNLSIHLGLIGLFISFILDLGYLFGNPLLYNLEIIPPALNTSISFTLLFLGILLKFGIEEKPIVLFTGNSEKAIMMRSFLPLILLIAIISGWINTFASRFYSDHVLINAIVSIFSIFAFSFIIFKITSKIGNNIKKASDLREKAELALRESELHFRTLSDSGQALIWTSGLDKECNYFNTPWLSYTGKRLEQELGNGWVEGVHPDDREKCIRIYIDAFDKREKFNMEYRLLHNTGTYRWIHDTGSPRYDLNGDFLGYIGHCLDIHDFKTAENQLKESEERYRQISSVATDYTFSTKVNPDGTFYLDWIAGALETISGYSLEEYIAHGGWRAILHPDDLPTDDYDFARLCKREDIESELRTINKSGEIVWVQVFAHPVWDEEINCLSGIYGAVKNINDRKQAEERLKASEAQFRELLEKINLISVILDTQGNVIFCNDYLSKLTGFKKDEIVGQNWFEKMIPESKTNINEIFISEIASGKIPIRFENPIYNKPGETLDIVWSNVIQRNNKGEITGVASIGEDVTEQRIADNKLMKERKLLRTLIDNLPATIYIKDIEGRKTIANKADIDIIGAKTEEEVLGKTDMEIFEGEIGLRGFSDDISVIKTGIPILNREEDFTDSEGNQSWLLTSKIPIADETGKSMGLVGIGRDITEQKLAEAKISKLSKGIEQSPSSIFITDTNGNIEYINPAFTKTSGYSENDVLRQNPRILKSGLMPDSLYKELWETIVSGNVWRGELLNRKKDGTLYWESATITGIKNEKGIVTNYVAINEDITEQKKMQAELIHAKEKAEESDRLKSAFLANMSHEIRTPLNSIIGFSELLGDPYFDQEQKTEFIRTIVENGNSLLLIISDIMDFSMLEARQLKIRIETISSKKLINDLFVDFKARVSRKNLELRISISKPDNDIIFESDLYRIKQIFNNLIGNSLKFTENGSIEIGYELTGNFIQFHVKDTGIGIPEEYHQAIFDRFRQVDTTKTRRYGGNGLGLAISKNLVELLGGTIWVESEPEKFSNFFFTIPINTEDHQQTTTL